MLKPAVRYSTAVVHRTTPWPATLKRAVRLLSVTAVGVGSVIDSRLPSAPSPPSTPLPALLAFDPLGDGLTVAVCQGCAVTLDAPAAAGSSSATGRSTNFDGVAAVAAEGAEGNGGVDGGGSVVDAATAASGSGSAGCAIGGGPPVGCYRASAGEAAAVSIGHQPDPSTSGATCAAGAVCAPPPPPPEPSWMSTSAPSATP